MQPIQIRIKGLLTWRQVGGDFSDCEKKFSCLQVNRKTAPLIYDVNNHFPDEFMSSVAGFKSYRKQHDAYCVNYGSC